MILIVTLFFFLATGIVFAILFLLRRVLRYSLGMVGWLQKVSSSMLLLASGVFAGLVTCFVIFTTHGSNDRSAQIKKEGHHYIISLTGRLSYGVHDLFDVLSRRTYKDSLQFLIPRKEGRISVGELKWEGSGAWFGFIEITGDALRVEFRGDERGSEGEQPFSWNGNYELIWK